MKRLIDFDPFTGIETWHELDHAEKKTRIYYVPTRDETPTVDYCKAIANDGDVWKRGVKEDWVPYAHIPNSLMLKWHIEEGVPLYDAYEYNRRANRPEYNALKLTTKHDGAKDHKIYIG